MRNFPTVSSNQPLPTDEDVRRAQDAFIHQRLPQWLKDASAQDISNLRSLFAAHKASQDAFRQATAAALSVPEYARQQFSRVLKDLLPADQRLDTLEWRQQLIRGISDQPPYVDSDFRLEPGLLRLMQNFGVGATPLEGSGLVAPGTSKVISGDLEALVKACRELDAGSRYQALLHDTFGKHQALLVKDKQAGFKLAVHIAFLKKTIDADTKAALEGCISGEQTESGLTAYPGLMSVMKVRIHEALFVQLRGPDDSDRGVVVYLPGDPVEPVRWYASSQALSAALVVDLRDTKYMNAFVQLIALRDRKEFTHTLLNRLRDKVPDLEVEGETGTGQVFERWARDQINRVENDAKVLLVSTADANAIASKERLEAWKGLGWGLANVAGFFIPEVGALLLAQMLTQVCAEVFEGTVDWAKGHDHEALEHVLNVAETLAAAAATTGVVAGAGVALRHFTRSTFVDGLEAVCTGGSAEGRLWSADLSVYRTSAEGAELADDGLYHLGERRWIRVDPHFYEVHQTIENGPWRIRHPQRPEAYGPVVERNGERFWRLPDETPLMWNDAAMMLDRLWPQRQPLDQQTAQQVLQAACCDLDELRGILVENRALPVNLRSTLRAFAADARINRFFDTLQASGEIRDPQLDDWCRQQPVLAEVKASDLTGAMLQHAPRLRQSMFGHLTRTDAGTDPAVQLILRDFPDLAPDYASELASRLSLPEREEVELRRRLPLSVSTQARSLQQLARLNRAQQGLMLRNAYNDVTGEVVFAVLSRLDHWSYAERLELRERSSSGRLLAVLNPQSPEATQAILVHKDGQFILHDERGVALEQQSVEPDDLFHVITTLLSTEQRLGLGLGSVEQAATLRRQVIDKLPVDREKLLRLFGWVARKGWFNPGQRLPDGRVGYALGGGYSREWAPVLRIRRRLAELYEGDSPRQIDVHVQRIMESDRPFDTLLFEEQNFRLLNGQLGEWVAGAAGHEQAARRQFARSMRAAWRRQLPNDAEQQRGHGLLLDLSGHQVTSLPELHRGIDFNHVTTLVMVNTPLQSMPNAFFSCFGQLRRLNLARNRLTAVPEGIQHLARLETLQLSHNSIRLEEQGRNTLAELTHLTSLDLSFNPLRRMTLHFHQAPVLTHLYLAHCRLLEWPVGLEYCWLLRLVDLRSNQLDEIPDTIMRMPFGFRSALRLDHNSIPLEQLNRLRARPRHELHHVQEAPSTQRSARQVWVGPQATAEQAARWDRLFAGDNQTSLLNLLKKLQDSADYLNAAYRENLTTRVWALLEAMDDDAELAQAINTLASEDTTCVDNVAERFSELQVHALVVKANRAPAGQKAALLELGLGLFRLEALKMFIREDIAARLLVDPELDQVEASLYYLVTLAKELELPAQPRSMTFARLGEVSKTKLDEARNHVKAAQTIEAQAWFLSEQEFWSKWLQAQEQNTAQFKAITDDYAARADALVDQEGLTSEQYLERWTTLDALRNAAFSRLKVLLTKEVLQARAEDALGRTSDPER